MHRAQLLGVLFQLWLGLEPRLIKEPGFCWGDFCLVVFGCFLGLGFSV